MAITMKDTGKKYTGDTIKDLIALLGAPPAAVSQTLTQFDFGNRSFANLKDLAMALKFELNPVRLAMFVTPDADVERAVNGKFVTNVVLVRGTSKDSAYRAMAAKSAGGDPANFATLRPTDGAAVSQVGGSQVGKPQVKLPEFTALKSKADKWATRGGWLYVKISAAFLLRGDVGECGWVANKSAPILDAVFVPHPHPVAMNMPNAD